MFEVSQILKPEVETCCTSGVTGKEMGHDQGQRSFSDWLSASCEDDKQGGADEQASDAQQPVDVVCPGIEEDPEVDEQAALLAAKLMVFWNTASHTETEEANVHSVSEDESGTNSEQDGEEEGSETEVAGDETQTVAFGQTSSEIPTTPDLPQEATSAPTEADGVPVGEEKEDRPIEEAHGKDTEEQKGLEEQVDAAQTVEMKVPVLETDHETVKTPVSDAAQSVAPQPSSTPDSIELESASKREELPVVEGGHTNPIPGDPKPIDQHSMSNIAFDGEQPAASAERLPSNEADVQDLFARPVEGEMGRTVEPRTQSVKDLEAAVLAAASPRQDVQAPVTEAPSVLEAGNERQGVELSGAVAAPAAATDDGGQGATGQESASDFNRSGLTGLETESRTEQTAAPTPSFSETATTAPRVMDLSQLAEQLDRVVLNAIRTDGRTLSIELEPAYLGRLIVQCRETQDGLRVEISAESEAVRSLLSGQEQDLRQTLEAQGLQMGRFSVSYREPESRAFDDYNQQERSSAQEDREERDERDQAGTRVEEEGDPGTAERSTGEPVWYQGALRKQWVA